jgi:uncharacterized protein YkvS
MSVIAKKKLSSCCWRETFMNQEIANVGDEVVGHNSIRGIVEKIYKNSVIIYILKNDTGKEYEGNKTVISHKNYRIIANGNLH